MRGTVARPARRSSRSLRWQNGIPHITSLPLDQQLVRELERRVTIVKIIQVFPRRHQCREPFPLDKELAHSTSQPGAQYLTGNRLSHSILNGRQRWW